MKHNKFDLESELRASRAQPRVDFARALADEVQSNRAARRSPAGRVGLALALSGLIVVALASFGGIGYASSAASHAVKKPTVAKHIRVVTSSAAQAQYAPFKPPKPNPNANPNAAGNAGGSAGTTGGSGTAGAGAGANGQNAAPKVTTSQLPFTGLALWMPLAIGLLLLATGLVLRTRSRKRSSDAAHS